ncbi:MAG: alpha/beta hydrolase [Flavisolibacter sp.]
MTVYFISGLGADRRVFSRLEMPSSITVKYIDWIEPLDKESLHDYCIRLAGQIQIDDDIVLVGLSFGGMVAIEMEKIVHPKHIIIISSIATRNELPFYFRIIRTLRLHRTISVSLMKRMAPIAHWYFNARTKKEKTMLQSYLQTVSSRYLKWSINEVLNWQNQHRPTQLFHIHGTADRTFPCRYTRADMLVKNGGHLMVYDKAKEVNEVLLNQLVKIVDS